MSDSKPFHNPFGELASLRDRLRDTGQVPEQDASARSAPVPPVEQKSRSGPGSIPRAVVRLERSGRGGKEVTVIEHLAIAPGDREVWLKALKSALGCGGSVEGDTLVLQGDHRKRLPELLTARGVRKITKGA